MPWTIASYGDDVSGRGLPHLPGHPEVAMCFKKEQGQGRRVGRVEQKGEVVR